jgi:hypothetical protein
MDFFPLHFITKRMEALLISLLQEKEDIKYRIQNKKGPQMGPIVIEAY